MPSKKEPKPQRDTKGCLARGGCGNLNCCHSGTGGRDQSLAMLLEELTARGGGEYLRRLDDHLFVLLLVAAMSGESEIQHTGEVDLVGDATGVGT